MAQPAKNVSELYILYVEDALKDIKRHMKEWNYNFSVTQIQHILTLPLVKKDDQIYFVNTDDYVQQKFIEKNCW
mgnify:FL=1